MAENTPAILRTPVSQIPALPSTTRKRASYDKDVQRYDLKYREPPTSDNSSTTSSRSPILTPSTSGHASPEVPAPVICGATQLDENSLKTSPPTLASTPSTSAHPRLAASPPDEEDIYTPADSLLRQTQALLHAELEILMQALHLRLDTPLVHTSPVLAASYVSAFEDLAANTMFSGMGERILLNVGYRWARNEWSTENPRFLERRQFAGSLETHLLIEAAKNTRRFSRGWNFHEEFDKGSTVTEVRNPMYREGEGELTRDSLIGDVEKWRRSVGGETKKEEHGASINNDCEIRLDVCDCEICSEGVAQLIQEYWAAVQQAYAAQQELELKLGCTEWAKDLAKGDEEFHELDGSEEADESQELEERTGSAEDEESTSEAKEHEDTLDWLLNLREDETTDSSDKGSQHTPSNRVSSEAQESDHISDWDWNSTDDEQDRQDDHDTEDEIRWAAKIDAEARDLNEGKLKEEIQHEMLAAEAALTA